MRFYSLICGLVAEEDLIPTDIDFLEMKLAGDFDFSRAIGIDFNLHTNAKNINF